MHKLMIPVVAISFRSENVSFLFPFLRENGNHEFPFPIKTCTLDFSVRKVEPDTTWSKFLAHRVNYIQQCITSRWILTSGMCFNIENRSKSSPAACSRHRLYWQKAGLENETNMFCSRAFFNLADSWASCIYAPYRYRISTCLLEFRGGHCQRAKHTKQQQDAQLSQRTGRQYFTDIIGLFSTNVI